ncbi:subtilisin-like protease SBT4.3 [Miscanthus floridulus]|uniref:subtilisin-like protease SBT4.3 n=1 Tax=Miscanthus floridulus TaxID=154761 RepID=UPI003458E808
MRCLSICLLLLALFTESVCASDSVISGSGNNGEQDYIVYLGHLPSTESDTSSEADGAGLSTIEAAHHDLLNQVLDDGSYASDRIVCSYKRSLNGFAARLTEQQANKLAGFRRVHYLKWLVACSKVIGARAYQNGVTGSSPLDEMDHRRHTASTVAGRAVGSVSFGGLAAAGQARHLQEPAGHRVVPRLVTSASAANSGLSGGRVCNVAPWMLSVAASSIDRRFVDRVVLGNGKTIVGSSVNTFPPVNNVTLAFPVDGSCDPDDLVGDSYKRKILLCPVEGGFRTNMHVRSWLA